LRKSSGDGAGSNYGDQLLEQLADTTDRLRFWQEVWMSQDDHRRITILFSNHWWEMKTAPRAISEEVIDYTAQGFRPLST
jgi:hypothetical protein